MGIDGIDKCDIFDEYYEDGFVGDQPSTCDKLDETELPGYANEVAKFLYDNVKDKDGRIILDNLEYAVINNKHKDFELCFRDKWNFPITNLSDENLCATWAEKKAMTPYYEWLGERISLCLNINKGKSNEQLREIYENKNKGGME